MVNVEWMHKNSSIFIEFLQNLLYSWHDLCIELDFFGVGASAAQEIVDEVNGCWGFDE